MGQQLDTWQVVDAPAVIPQPFGIFSVAEPRLTTDEHWRLGVKWRSNACEPAYWTKGPCIESLDPALTPNDSCSIFEYEPFTVYSYNTDPAIGYTLDQHRATTIERLVNAEQKQVEALLWSAMLGGSTFYSATSFSPEFALGLLENEIAIRYNGVGVIHMSKVAATVFSDTQLIQQGGRLYTNLGTPVVISSSYDPRPLPVFDGKARLMATGPLALYRGDIDVREASFDKATNQVSYVAQRDYVVGWDCSAVQVEATLSPASF